MNIKPKKSLGQHFLKSKSALTKIVAAAGLSAGETVLEVGPGTGALTEVLMRAGGRVMAVEKDRRSYSFLQEKFKDEIADGSLRLFEGDILAFDRAAAGLTDGSYVVAANIPYYITGAILRYFLETGPRPRRAVLLVQKEVAERIVAADGKESILSISVKAFGTPRIVATVPRGAFSPPPTVDSAILAIDDISDKRFSYMTDSGVGGIDAVRSGYRRDCGSAENGIYSSHALQRFFEIVRAGFAHKRKYAARNLESVMPKEHINRLWEEMKISEKIRAEDIPLETWVRIAKSA